MKRFFSLFLTAALAGAGFVSCSDDPEDQPVVPTDVEKVSGIETNYVLGLHEYLEITPDIELSNENESISYEWSIDYETVSTERNLSFKCDELLNDVNCYFKASSSTGAKIAEFKLSVTSPYDKGLLLLSQTGEDPGIQRGPDLPESLEAPVAAGQEVGGVEVVVDGRPVARIPVLAAREVTAKGLKNALSRVLRAWEL